MGTYAQKLKGIGAGIKHYWSYQATGTTVDDEIGSADATMSGAATGTVAGPDGIAVRADQIVGTLPSFIGPNNWPLTVAAWVRPTGSTDSRYIVDAGWFGGNGWRILFAAGTTRLFGALRTNPTSANIFPAYEMSLNTWHHVAMRFSVAGNQIFVDGVLRDTVAIGGPADNWGGGESLIGRDAEGQTAFAHIAVWGESLSDADIVSLADPTGTPSAGGKMDLVTTLIVAGMID